MEKWLEDLVGCPYLENGLDPAVGLDCFGLVRYVLREALNVQLPEKLYGWRRHGVVLPAQTELGRYDILFFSRNPQGMVDHMGIAVSPTDFLHADKLCGQVVCMPVSRAGQKLKAVGRAFAAIET